MDSAERGSKETRSQDQHAREGERKYRGTLRPVETTEFLGGVAGEALGETK